VINDLEKDSNKNINEVKKSTNDLDEKLSNMNEVCGKLKL
jgi:hypothetical protein